MLVELPCRARSASGNSGGRMRRGRANGYARASGARMWDRSRDGLLHMHRILVLTGRLLLLDCHPLVAVPQTAAGWAERPNFLTLEVKRRRPAGPDPRKSPPTRSCLPDAPACSRGHQRLHAVRPPSGKGLSEVNIQEWVFYSVYDRATARGWNDV